MVRNRELILRSGTYRVQADYDDAWLLACALRSKVVMDIGCNVGQASVIMSFSNAVNHVVLVDANPWALVIASENVLGNQLFNTTSFVCSFVSDTSNALQEFWTVKGGAAGSMFKSHAKTAHKRGTHYNINTTTIDSLCKDMNLNPDLIKIDVEGAESKALSGAKQQAMKQTTRFFVEMHSNAELTMLQNARLILDWCSQVGYSPWYLSEHILLSSAEQLAPRGRCHLLLQPEKWSFPEWLININQADSLEKILL